MTNTHEPLTLAVLVERLDAAGVKYTRNGETLEISGYGSVWYDDGAVSHYRGWVAAEYGVSEARLLSDLDDLGNR